MVNALRGRQTEYQTARWYTGERNGPYKQIRVEIVSDKEKQFNPIINLVAERASTILRTSFCYDYQRAQQIFYNGTWWKITDVTDDNKSSAPQSLRVAKPRPLKILGLTETKA